MRLNRTGSNWAELERNKINENWDIIEGNHNKLEGEFNDVVGKITDEVIGHLIDSARLDWKEPVDTVEDLPANAEVGETRMVREADPDGISYVYRYDGENWEKIQAIDVTLVNEVDRRLTRQLADIVIDVKTYIKEEDGDNAVPGIRRAIADAPLGATLRFPPTSASYKLKMVEPNDEYLFLWDKPLKIEGSGMKSLLSIDASVPNTCDIFCLNPKETGDVYFTGYHVDGLAVISSGANNPRHARHIFNIKTVEAGKKIAYSSWTNNIFYEVGGYAIHLENPSNSDAFFCVQIQNNLIRSGMSLGRAGDSVTVTGNTFAGYNDIYIRLVSGSNAFNFAFNNVTLRGGLILKSGFNTRFVYNNFEVGYSDTSTANNAFVDIDGSDNGSFGMLNIEFASNNISYRKNTAPEGIDALRINRARGAVVRDNHISNFGSYHINITENAEITLIDYNQFPSADGVYEPQGKILDKGRDTKRENTWTRPQANSDDLYDVWQHDAENVRHKGDFLTQKFHRYYYEAARSAQQVNHDFIYGFNNPNSIKTIFRTVKKNEDGSYTDANNVMYFTASSVLFPDTGFRLLSNAGTSHNIRYMSSSPSSGTFSRGDIVYNSLPSPGGVLGWVCVAAGTPGTWRSFGNLSS